MYVSISLTNEGDPLGREVAQQQRQHRLVVVLPDGEVVGLEAVPVVGTTDQAHQCRWHCQGETAEHRGERQGARERRAADAEHVLEVVLGAVEGFVRGCR